MPECCGTWELSGREESGTCRIGSDGNSHEEKQVGKETG